MLTCMHTLETDIEIAEDGSVKLLSPLPEWLKPGRAHVLLAKADPLSLRAIMQRYRLPKATPEMVARRSEALKQLRAMGGLQEAIPDPVAWQKEMREDVKLPGRD